MATRIENVNREMLIFCFSYCGRNEEIYSRFFERKEFDCINERKVSEWKHTKVSWKKERVSERRGDKEKIRWINKNEKENKINQSLRMEKNGHLKMNKVKGGGTGEERGGDVMNKEEGSEMTKEKGSEKMKKT